jgi:SpoVK/Ycf46/Vps4 family AAA+-type ATPase
VEVEGARHELRPGDLILWDRNAQIALGRLDSDSQSGYEDVGHATPPALGGLSQVCEDVVARFIFSITHPDIAREYQVDADNGKRLLLIGPPGTGKTTMMRMIAGKIAAATGQDCRVITIAGAELHSSYVGETESNIRRVFATLNDYDGPAIVFFDEFDAIARARGNQSGFHEDRFLGTLLAEIEGIRGSNVAVIAATNRADALDPAARSRFSWEIDMPRPGITAARQIFSIHMSVDVPYQTNGSEAPTSRELIIDSGVSRLFEPNSDNKIASLQFRDGKKREIAARELVSGRLIEQVCDSARIAAFERQCRGGQSGVSVNDMQVAADNAIERLRNTLTTRNVGDFITDLPQDMDVVSVDPIRPRINATRYTH